ncbi:MAG TPA: CocE/NonD family hydrolase [Conexibacter sp.]|jgi:hypothetical protein
MTGTELGVRVERDVPLTTRDGTILRSDVYRPAAAGRYPVLLGRTCYGKGSWGDWIEPEKTAAEGWVVVINDTRGSFASDGEFRPFFFDAPDGYDTVEWCAAQEWCNGRVGMFGSSAPGFVQLLAAVERPPHLVAIAPMQTWTSHGRGCVYDPGGAFMLYTAQWSLMIAGMDPERQLGAGSDGYAERLAAVRAANADPAAWLSQLPLGDLPLPRPQLDYFYRWLEHPEVDDFWEPLDIGRRFAEIEIPALHLVGLFDKFRFGSTRNYRGLRDHAGSERARAGQRLVIGPWTHGIPVEAKGSDYAFAADSAVDVRALLLRWYDHWLKGNDTGLLDEPAVRVWVQGADRWREAADWPLPEAQAVEYHLHSGGGANGSSGDGRLSTEAAGQEPVDTYVHDPANPVPTVTGEQTRSEGPIDIQEIERRADVLAYTSEPLDADLEVTGEIVMRLWAATSVRDADWVITLVDVAPDGAARRVTEGMLRARYRDGHDRAVPVEPGAAVEYEIELRPTANLFRAGHRIRVDVASSSFAQYDRNLGRGDSSDGELGGGAAQQTVFHDTAHPSRIVLPAVR